MSAKRHVAIDGNEAISSVAYRLNEVIAIYPITPASPMGELCDEWAALGRHNLWGSVPDVVEMQSEAGAAGPWVSRSPNHHTPKAANTTISARNPLGMARLSRPDDRGQRGVGASGSFLTATSSARALSADTRPRVVTNVRAVLAYSSQPTS